MRSSIYSITFVKLFSKSLINFSHLDFPLATSNKNLVGPIPSAPLNCLKFDETYRYQLNH